MLNQNGGSRADTLVKLVLIFFISLLSFSIGTFVGKQFSDSQYKMAALEGEVGDVQRDTASVDPKSLDVTPSDALTEEDIANLEDEFVSNKKDDLAKLAEVPEQSDEVAAKAEVAPKAAARVAEGKSPFETTPTVTKRVPSSMPVRTASDSVGKYTVQVSSHNNEEEASKFAKELVSKGFSAFYLSADVNGKTWYRVGVGLHTNIKDAQKAREDLLKQSDIKTAIVQKVTDRQPAKAQN